MLFRSLAELDERSRQLEIDIALTEEHTAYALGIAGRVNLLETEYQQAMRRAELAWIRGLAGDLRSGRLDWNLEALLASLREAHERRAALAEPSR